MNDLIAAIKRERGSEISSLRRLLRGKARLRKFSPDEISEAERRMGILLPSDFRDFYQQIGSGDFGPGYGFLPLLPPSDPTEGNIVERYLLFMQGDPEEADFHWPEGLLQFCHWGCAIWSCIDCKTGKILRADPNFGTNYVIVQEAESFDSFMRLWLNDRLPFEIDSIKTAAAKMYPKA